VKQAFSQLVEHYRQTRRDLPWRRLRDPYAILVSEVMLQQTRVEVVLGYYKRFMERFPDCASLAAASSEELHAAWAGLGYYRRARNLQAACRAVVEGGGFPEDLRSLPGVGEYTAAALESIAFDRPALALDGNAIRVLWRFFALLSDPRSAPARRSLTTRVLPMIPPGCASDFTQALMELGALVCKPTNPCCLACPLEPWCQGKEQWRTLPPPAPKARAEEVVWKAYVLLRPGQVLLEKAGRGQLMEGMWVCPSSLPAGASADPVGVIRHAITFRRITCQVYRGSWDGPGSWVDTATLSARALPSLTRKILRCAL
jgi:A/G-specific adenine glycosylase